MGLAIAQALVHAPDARCKVHLVDIKQDAGHRAVAALGGPEHAVFHEADVTDYEQLAAAFRAAFLDDGGGGQGRRRPSSAGRLDYVFANAGIFERQKYFHDQEDSTSSDKDDDEPPPAPDYVALDVNVKGAINTVHLARHYIARSPDVQAGSIVITASCSSFWPTYWAPIYTASKCMFFFFVFFLPFPQWTCSLPNILMYLLLLPPKTNKIHTGPQSAS